MTRLYRDHVPPPESVLTPAVSYGDGPECVYLLQCWGDGAYYVGVAKASRLRARLLEHWRDAFLDTTSTVGEGAASGLRYEANVLFLTVYGLQVHLGRRVRH